MKELGTDSQATYKEARNGFPKAMDSPVTYKKWGSELPKLPINQVICSDSCEVLKEFPENSIDCVVTDPPFKVSQMYGGGTDADNLINVSSILKIIPQISRIVKEGRFAIFFYDNRILPFLFEATKGTELIYRKSIYLYRRWGNANRWMGWMQCTDPICFFVKGHTEPFHVKVKGKVHHDCYVKKHPEHITSGHPAQKPFELILELIRAFTKEGDTVLDPFLGSGTTMFACQQVKRNCIGIEINSEHCEIVKKRCFGRKFLDREVAYQSEVFDNTKSIVERP